MDGINVWAVLVAAVSAFVLGGLWYSPMLFGRRTSAATIVRNRSSGCR